MKKTIGYNDLFGAERALQLLFQKALPIDLALKLADLHGLLLPYKEKGIQALGPSPDEMRITQLSEKTIEIEFEPINRQQLVESLDKVEPFVLYNLNPFYEVSS